MSQLPPLTGDDALLGMLLRLTQMTDADVAERFGEFEKRILSEKTRVAAEMQEVNPSMSSTPLGGFNGAVNRAEAAMYKKRDVAFAALTKALASYLAYRAQAEELEHKRRRFDEVEKEKARQQDAGIYKEATALADDLRTHGVHRSYLRLNKEVIAVLADLILWFADDTQFQDAASPWPTIIDMYANRALLKPDERSSQADHRSRPGAAPVRPHLRKPDRYYRFEQGKSVAPAIPQTASGEAIGDPASMARLELCSVLEAKHETHGINPTPPVDAGAANINEASLSTVDPQASENKINQAIEAGASNSDPAALPVQKGFAKAAAPLRHDREHAPDVEHDLECNQTHPELAGVQASLGLAKESPDTISLPSNKTHHLRWHELTREQGEELARVIIDSNDEWLMPFWELSGQPVGRLDNPLLMSSLRKASDSGNMNAGRLLHALEQNQGYEFIVEQRRRSIHILSVQILDGNRLAIKQAAEMGILRPDL